MEASHLRWEIENEKKTPPLKGKSGSSSPLFLDLFLPFLLILSVQSYAIELRDALSGLQNRYAFIQTVKGNFHQTYRAPGIRREESGEFWLKKPGLMRWEYRSPEEQLFVADGRESFLYVPRDRQLTVQPLSAADLHSTPLELLLNPGNVEKSFAASWETQFKPAAERTLLIRLTPRRPAQYSFLVLEIDGGNFEIRRISVHEPTGSISEFMLSNVTTNAKLDDKLFKFKIPKGTEVTRMKSE